jgi:hypothetical protein
MVITAELQGGDDGADITNAVKKYANDFGL